MIILFIFLDKKLLDKIQKKKFMLYLFIYYTYENHPTGNLKNKFKNLKEKRKEE